MARELFKQENVLSAKNGKTAKKQSRKQRGKAKRREPAKPKKTPPAPILTLIPGWKLTEQDIEAGRSERGGFGRKELAKFGVPYPPPKLWKQSLIEGRPLSPAMKRRFKGIWPEPTEEMASHYGIPLH
jgi:hypothetical protein